MKYLKIFEEFKNSELFEFKNNVHSELFDYQNQKIKGFYIIEIRPEEGRMSFILSDKKIEKGVTTTDHFSNEDEKILIWDKSGWSLPKEMQRYLDPLNTEDQKILDDIENILKKYY